MRAQLTSADALLVLNGLNRVGPVTLRRLLNAFEQDATAILSAPLSALLQVPGVGRETAQLVQAWPEHFDLEAEKLRLADSGLEFLASTDVAYPALLRELHDPPTGLYARGPLRLFERCVGIVGTRHASLYGLEMARKLASGLARAGWCVVSGMARGIDTAAHQGALEAGGHTVAVLGCGPDIIYPPDNVELHRQIAQTGCVLSEFKFGTRASKTTFPMRNRLISGMCRGIVVVESNARGGSLITAKFAAEQNRIVCAVPGRADQESAVGCHQLIRDGAVLVTSVEEVIAELGYPRSLQAELPWQDFADNSAQASPSAAWAEGLSEEEAPVVAALLQHGPLPGDVLADLTGLPISSLNATLLLLELRAKVKKSPDGTFVATGL